MKSTADVLSEYSKSMGEPPFVYQSMSVYSVLPVPPFEFVRFMDVIFGVINREPVNVEYAPVHFAAMIRAVFEINFFRVLPLQGFYCVIADVGQVPGHVLPDAGYAFEFGFYRIALPWVLA
jgi:hypothetical protein